MTKYMILAKGDKPDAGWVETAIVEAASARAAIREALNGASEGGEYVAVPARSWEPVKVEIQQAIKIS